jgi:hypothetical protein
MLGAEWVTAAICAIFGISTGSEDRCGRIPRGYETYKRRRLENFAPRCDN